MTDDDGEVSRRLAVVLLRERNEARAALVEARQENERLTTLVAERLWLIEQLSAHNTHISADLAAAVAALTHIAAMCKVSGGRYHLDRIAAIASSTTPQTCTCTRGSDGPDESCPVHGRETGAPND